MKRIVLIDGENLSRALRNMIGSVENPAPRTALVNFNYKALIDEVIGDNKKSQIFYFGARLHKHSNDSNLLEKTTEAIKLQSKLVNSLHKQGISFVKVGYLRARETKPCKKCGDSNWTMIEKGVDVGLAVQMVLEADPNTEIIIFSADTDLVPAVKAATKKGSKVMFVGYEYQAAISIAKVASVTRLISKPMIDKVLKGKNNG